MLQPSPRTSTYNRTNTAKCSQHISSALSSRGSTQSPCPPSTPAASSSPFLANTPMPTPHSYLPRVTQPMRPSSMASGTSPPHQDHPDCNLPRGQRHIHLCRTYALSPKKFWPASEILPTSGVPPKLHRLEPVLLKQTTFLPS